MKIDNRTGYRLRDIRKLVLAGMKAEGVSPRKYQIEIGRTGSGHIHGRAGIGWPWVVMYIPNGWSADLLPDDVRTFAQVFVHEVGHTLGLKHRDQIDIRKIPTPWADGLILRRKPERPVMSVRERRANNARRKLDEHSRKLKREQNLVKKWRSKVRYYERTLAAGGGGE